MRNKGFWLTLVIMTTSLIGMAISLGTTLAGKQFGAMGESPRAVYLVMLGLLGIVFIVEIISAIRIDDSTFHTVVIVGTLVVQLLCSSDSQMVFESFGADVPELTFAIIGEVAFLAMQMGCYRYIAYLYGISLDQKKKIVLLTTALLPAVYAAAFVTGYGYIAHFAMYILLTAAFCGLIYSAEKKVKLGFTTYFVSAVFAFGAGVQNVNALYFSGVTGYVPGLTLAYATLSFSMFIPVYLRFVIHSDDAAVKSAGYKKRAERLESQAFAGQIKPHFIFNSLETIRFLYHRDVSEGDAALKFLSDFLRGSINSFDSELIPFETEIDNVYAYTEFENMKRNKKVDVMFNIDFTEFSVPPFSIQPFVENAMKYSGVEEKEGGCVIITSYRKDDKAIVEIYDDGVGFDVNAVSEKSHGIKNAVSRFSLMLGVEPEIKSEPGEGTRIKIAINLNGGGAH